MKKYQMPTIACSEVEDILIIMAESGQIDKPGQYFAPKVQHGL